jgi:DNA-binding NarL/FixJ family response regulator
MAMRQTRILLVDDHPIVRQGLSQMIDREPDFTVCGEAEDVISATRAVAMLKPDIVVVDISLNGPGGLEIMRCMRETDPELRVLILSMYDEMVYAERALRAGANGYIMKQEATEDILGALRRILGGEVYVSERVANKVLKRLARGDGVMRPMPVESLTDRELEVYRLIGEGHGTRQISEELNLSVKTVETYQAHIKAKLGLKNGRELVQHAVAWATGKKRSTESSLSAESNTNDHESFANTLGN